jgi:uncharacterized protein (DUF924 family)
MSVHTAYQIALIIKLCIKEMDKFIIHSMRIFVLEVIHHSSNIADASNLMKLFETLVYSPHVKVKASNILQTSHT